MSAPNLLKFFIKARKKAYKQSFLCKAVAKRAFTTHIECNENMI